MLSTAEMHRLTSSDLWPCVNWPKEGLAVLDKICNIYIPATWIRSAHEMGPPLAPSSVLFFKSSKKLMAFSSPWFSGLVSSALHLTKVRPRCRMLIIPARESELTYFLCKSRKHPHHKTSKCIYQHWFHIDSITPNYNMNQLWPK